MESAGEELIPIEIRQRKRIPRKDNLMDRMDVTELATIRNEGRASSPASECLDWGDR